MKKLLLSLLLLAFPLIARAQSDINEFQSAPGLTPGALKANPVFTPRVIQVNK